MEQCGECEDMKNIRFERYSNSLNQFGIIIPDCIYTEKDAYISEKCLLTLLQQLLEVMDDPKMDGVDYSKLNDLSGQLQKKCKEKIKANKAGAKKTLNHSRSSTKKQKNGNAQTTCEDTKQPDSKESPEEIEQWLLQKEEQWKQEEREREKERCKARDNWFQAKRELAEEKAKYSKAKRIEQIFNGKVQPMVQPFLKLMESLIYFAGCLNAEDFSTRKRILSNRQQLLCSNLQASTWGFSLDREAFQGVDEMLAAMSQETKLPELPQISDRLTAELTAEEEYLQKKQETEKLKRQYLLENEKLRLNDFRQKQILEYICLFRELYPVVVKICAESQTDIEEQWAISIGREIVRIVDQHQSRNESMKFIFVYPDNEAHTQNESVKIDFIAAEADCPGLYYRDSSGELICVIPGRVK